MVRSRERIKILYTIPNFDTAGSGKALLNLARGLNPAKFDVHIACLNNKGSLFEMAKESGIPIYVFDFVRIMKPYIKGILESRKVARRFKDISPDIIHSFHYGPDYSEALAAKMAGIKWIYTKKNMNWGGPSKNSWFLRSWLSKAIVVHNTDMLNLFFANPGKHSLYPEESIPIHFALAGNQII